MKQATSTASFSGTRKGMTTAQHKALQGHLDVLRSTVGLVAIHHGGCKGADTELHAIARDLQLMVEVHPGDAKQAHGWHGARVWTVEPYLVRNRTMVDASDMLLAVPETFIEFSRSGTWSTVRYARKASKPVLVIYPDGSGKWENVDG